GNGNGRAAVFPNFPPGLAGTEIRREWSLRAPLDPGVEKRSRRDDSRTVADAANLPRLPAARGRSRGTAAQSPGTLQIRSRLRLMASSQITAKAFLPQRTQRFAEENAEFFKIERNAFNIFENVDSSY